jgi:hypothetical protein
MQGYATKCGPQRLSTPNQVGSFYGHIVAGAWTQSHRRRASQTSGRGYLAEKQEPWLYGVGA